MGNRPALILISGLFLALNACKGQPDLTGGWSIEGIKPYTPLYTNGLELYEGDSCDLPMTDTSSAKGTWTSFKKDGNYYLQINSPEILFNDTYEVTSFNEVRDTVSWGVLLVMELQSPRTWMLCKRAKY